MINESLFFDLARKWKKEKKNEHYFFILEDVVQHYLRCIDGYRDIQELAIHGAHYTIDEIMFVLDAVGYYNYSVKKADQTGNIFVILRNQL